ncbi:MAG TPA: single-stranded-DNA-specific exonuclease RecJ [Ktedonobacterales bacterium]|nr:single-stranded-DNA-specific exonuclease RecJ [Ktedonobacterales bacterium]
MSDDVQHGSAGGVDGGRPAGAEHVPFAALCRPFRIAGELPRHELNALDGLTPLQMQLLHNRGFRSAEAVRAHLDADWRAERPALPNLDPAVERIVRALREGEHIVVFGDYDCDGLTSCALLASFLRTAGANANVEPYVPTREDDGRGLNLTIVRELAERGVRLIVTTDCGTANVAEVELARELGMDVIVTDHHPPLGPVAPALAVLNPHLATDATQQRDLAGVGVAFRLAQTLAARLDRDGLWPPDSASARGLLASLLDLVAIGTIADVAPLTPENWMLARTGLKRLRDAPRPGLRALIESAGLRRDDVSARDVSFALAPRLNASGRLGQPMIAVQLLMSDDAAEAKGLAAQLEGLNVKRQRITETILAEARHQIASQIGLAPGVAPTAENGFSTVVIAVGKDWPLGVLGLVAGRLSEEFHRPAFVISRGEHESRGSARARHGARLGELLAARPEFFRRFGGHAQAAGFTLATTDLDAFLAYIRERLAAPLPKTSSSLDTGATSERMDGDAADTDTANADEIVVDCRLPLRRVVPEVYDAVRELEPFGSGFAEPLFICRGVRVTRVWRSGVEGGNLRLALREDRGTGPACERVATWARQGQLHDTVRAALSTLPALDVVYSLSAYRRRPDGPPDIIPRIVTVAPAGECGT